MSFCLSGFTPYDFRAKLGHQLNPSVAKAIAYAYVKITGAKNICLGEDARLSSNELKQALISGIVKTGSNVYDLGLTATEEIYFATVHLKLDAGGIQVTASHNPINYNGFKFVGLNSVPIMKESGLNEIKILAEKIS